MSEHWQEPEGGKFSVAIPAQDFHTKRDEVEAFFGRRLSTYSYCLTFGQRFYLVVHFADEADAAKAMRTFEGEPFDPRDKGRGTNWMKWMKGRGAQQDGRRNPYKWFHR